MPVLRVYLETNAMGSVDVNGVECTATNCSFTIATGTSVTLTPLPDTGFTFGHWSPTCNEICTFDMPSTDYDITCYFTTATWTLNIINTPAAGGYVTVVGDGYNDSCEDSCAYPGIAHGTTVTLTQNHATGWHFTGWVGGGCGGTGSTCSVYMNADKTVTAYWALDSPPPPPPPEGACCKGTSVCLNNYTENECTSESGIWQGEGTDCDPFPCGADPTGACCIGTNCSLTTQANCTGTWQGAGTTCSPTNPCDGGGGGTSDQTMTYLLLAGAGLIGVGILVFLLRRPRIPMPIYYPSLQPQAPAKKKSTTKKKRKK